MIQFDATSIKDRLKEKLRAKSSWANILFYSTNQRIIDATAEEIAYDMLMNDINTVECKWNLAQQVSSLMAQTQFFNYYPYRKNGASGLLKVSTSKTFNATYAKTVPILKYSIFSTESSTNVCCSETTNLTKGSQFVNIKIVQGTPKSLNYVANGDEFETITVKNKFIENNVFDVYVNGELWTNVLNIRDATDATSKVYVVNNLLDFSGIEIIFGDDSFGRKLQTGDQVQFKYIETLGSEGNITSSNFITTVVSTFTDTDGDSVELFCANDSPITGGTDEENLEHIRARAPAVYQAGDRAITKSDYKSIVEKFSFVKKATVWGETEVNEDLGNIPGTFIALEENVVHISAISSIDSSITSEQELQIRAELNEKKPPTDIIVFENPNFVFIHFTSNVFVSDKRYSLDIVKANVLFALQNDYSIDNLDFKKIIRYSDYVSKIDSVEGVDYHETSLSYYKLSNFTSAYILPIVINMDDIKTSSVKVYVKLATSSDSSYSLVAHDNGLGVFVADAGYTVSGSAFNYETGIGNLIVTSGLSSAYNLYVSKTTFETTIDNIVPTKRYQIISYGSSTINCSYE